MYIPGCSHFLSFISLPWAHLLKRGSEISLCLFTMWLRNDLNFAHMICPVPQMVEVALQCRWLRQGWIHSDNDSQPLSLAIFDKCFLTARKQILSYIRQMQKSMIFRWLCFRNILYSMPMYISSHNNTTSYHKQDKFIQTQIFWIILHFFKCHRSK